jgi:hypothetical protein
MPAFRVWFKQARCLLSGGRSISGRGQFKMPGDDPWNGDILIEGIPSQGKPVHLDLDGFQICIGRIPQATEPAGREGKLSLIGQFQMDHASADPCADSDWLSADGCGAHGIL